MINDELVNKKVLHIQTGSALTGGVSQYISSLVTGLSTDCSKFFVTCLRSDLEELESNRFYGDAKIAQVFHRDKSLWYFLGIFTIIKLIKKENIQIIHFHCLKSALLGFPIKVFCKATLVYTNHGLRYTLEKNFYRWFFYLFLELCVAKFVNNYISIRESDNFRISKIFSNNEKMRVIKTFSEPAQYKKKKNIPLDPNESSIVTLFFVGSLIEIKNPFRFLNWVEELNSTAETKVEAHIFGEGHLEISLKNEVLLKKLPVIFHGNVDQEDIFRFYNNNSLIYFCLTSDIDTLPMAALEAYFFGIPIITNDRPGLSDYFKDKVSGYLCSGPGMLIELKEILFSNSHYRSLSSSAKEFSLRTFPSYASWLYCHAKLYGIEKSVGKWETKN
tara:strand:- start:6098 stop:7261 length:1164 start_codon:yes stop_codon:yes gene_type:complete